MGKTFLQVGRLLLLTFIIIISGLLAWSRFMVFLAPVLKDPGGPDYVLVQIVLSILVILLVVIIYGLIKGRKIYYRTRQVRISSGRICLGFFYAIIVGLITYIGHETGFFLPLKEF